MVAGLCQGLVLLPQVLFRVVECMHGINVLSGPSLEKRTLYSEHQPKDAPSTCPRACVTAGTASAVHHGPHGSVLSGPSLEKRALYA